MSRTTLFWLVLCVALFTLAGCTMAEVASTTAAVGASAAAIAMPREVGGIIVHSAYDRRETGEVCRLALDLLGSALADHGHTWTPQEREAFEHAQHILAIHWPAKDSELRRG